jgi:hypothetical protein
MVKNISFRQKSVGWRNDSYRHYLAAKGVKTKVNKLIPRRYLASGLRPAFRLNGNELTIIPDVSFTDKVKKIKLTDKEVAQFNDWRSSRVPVQVAFPDWPASKRELLLTGLDDKEFKQYVTGDNYYG